MPLDARKVAESQAGLALGILTDPDTVPDINRAILLLDEARAGMGGMDPIIAMLFNKPVPRLSEAIIALRSVVPGAANEGAVDEAMNRMQQGLRSIDNVNGAVKMWRRIMESGPSESIRLSAAQRVQTALAEQQLNADALKRQIADVAGCVNVVYTELRTNQRETELANSSQSPS